MKVAVFGCGYVGLTSGVCLAAKGHEVTAVDIDPEVVAALEAGRPHIHEPGLAELLVEALKAGRLTVTTDLALALDDAEIAMLAVGTPSRDGAIDLRAIRKLARDIGIWLKNRDRFLAIMVKSTVVPGTTDTVIRGEIEAASGKRLGEFGLAMNPEFLREGQAVADFMAPDRIVLGHDDPQSLTLLERLYTSWDCDKLKVNSRTAELIKYASNALLAVQISAANEIANLATALGGIDAMDVMKGVHLDRRWNPIVDGSRVAPGILSYLLPGPGFGGSCLPKDLEALSAAGRGLGLPMAMTEAVLAVNRTQPGQVIATLERAVGLLADQRVLVLGLAFKPGTADLRDSASIRIVELLLDKGARVSVHDPLAGGNLSRALGTRADGVTLVEDWKAAVVGAEILVLATKWPEYRALAELDLAGKKLFDARRMFAPGELRTRGYLAIGRMADPAGKP
jgi:UDPglucose 6-dehydrogenase/GDP-mannose 6-dehydrogenase